ncbi:MAG: hypothetical protein H6628_04825 [Calditrichae bacterium]|nr:hypothetical protein [Calditrichia bacterium]
MPLNPGRCCRPAQLAGGNQQRVYQIENDRAVPLLDGTLFCAIPVAIRFHPNICRLDRRSGHPAIFKRAMAFLGRVPGISEEIRSIAEDPDGALWLGTQFQGALRVKLPPGKPVSELDETLLQVTRFGQTHHLPEGEVNVYPVNRRVRFATSQGLRSFDAHRQIFLRIQVLERCLLILLMPSTGWSKTVGAGMGGAGKGEFPRYRRIGTGSRWRLSLAKISALAHERFAAGVGDLSRTGRRRCGLVRQHRGHRAL